MGTSTEEEKGPFSGAGQETPVSENSEPVRHIKEIKTKEGEKAEETTGREEEDDEEARKLEGVKQVRPPTDEEWDEHMKTHRPFRDWCNFCVKGRGEKPTTQEDKQSKSGKA